MLYVVSIIYCLWAFYAGYQFLSGRSLWLDDDAILNRVVKLAASVAVGYVIGAFYLIYLIWKLITHRSF